MQIHGIRKYQVLNHFSQVGQELMIGDISVSHLITQYGTPLYVYDSKAIIKAYQSLAHYFPQFEIFYSIKANPNLAICTLLRSLGAGAEIASGGELHLSMLAGFDQSKIVFAGPAKTDNELASAVRAGIASINIESFSELTRLEEIARSNRKNIKACLRINTEQTDISTPEVMIGGSSRFGIDEEVILEKILEFDLNYVKLVGIHVYTASQILKIEDIIKNLNRTLSFASKWVKSTNLGLDIIDFGGGFGVPNYENEKELEFSLLTERVSETITKFSKLLPVKGIRLILELGRYLVACSGVYLTKIVDIKDSRGKTFLSTDGGMNQFLRPVLMNLNHPTLIVNKLGKHETKVVDIGGPLCTPIDKIARGVSIPEVELGDIVGFFNAGAYGFSMSLQNFSSHIHPPEVLVNNGNSFLIRERGGKEDYLLHQQLPSGLYEIM